MFLFILVHRRCFCPFRFLLLFSFPSIRHNVVCGWIAARNTAHRALRNNRRYASPLLEGRQSVGSGGHSLVATDGPTDGIRMVQKEGKVEQFFLHNDDRSCDNAGTVFLFALLLTRRRRCWRLRRALCNTVEGSAEFTASVRPSRVKDRSKGRVGNLFVVH